MVEMVSVAVTEKIGVAGGRWGGTNRNLPHSSSGSTTILIIHLSLNLKKTREKAVFSCCCEAMNFFEPNRNPSKHYLRSAALIFAPDNNSK